jgi:hypothetical protein
MKESYEGDQDEDTKEMTPIKFQRDFPIVSFNIIILPRS